MLKSNITTMLRDKGFDEPYAWMKKHGIARNSALKLSGGKYDRIRLSHIEVICYDARCTPNDLFAWTPGKGQDLSGHPLQSLRHNGESLDTLSKIHELTPAQIRLLDEFIRKMKELK